MSYNIKGDLSEKIAIRDKVYSVLSNAIFKGKLQPEERLVESKLAKAMKVSRTPVREAIIELQQKGLVVPSPPKGVKVAPLPTMKDLSEFYDIRGVLRGLAVRKAVKNITVKEIQYLEENIKKMETLLLENSIRRVSQLNIEFHSLIEKCSKSRELILLLDDLYKKSREHFAVIISKKERQIEAVKEHKKIVKALKEKNSELAEELMKHHAENAKKALEKEIIIHRNENV
ncbi:MAG: GntR family transcriptional regulator [Candidatus Atribacteria bacterium]|nr:GntR family transcriptional regulator [Candidatus Atribacteria bacterium]